MQKIFTRIISPLFFLLLSFSTIISVAFSQALPDTTIDGDPAFLTAPAGARVYGQIPVNKMDVYILNNAEYIDGLFDGDTTTSVHAGWGHIFAEQETWIQLRDYNAQVSQLHLMNDYDHTASPVRYYAVEKGTWNRVYLGSSYGTPTHSWNSIPATPLAIPINATYIIMVGPLAYPKELRIMGSYFPKPATTPPARIKKPFKNAIGNNFFEWDALESDTNTNDRYVIQENKMDALKIFKGGLRHYLDWERIETSRGVYEFNPTRNGGWNYDMVYKRLKDEGVPVVICVKSLPSWMLNSWPAQERDQENVPVFYQNNMEETVSSFENPASYIDGGKFFFQLAARYGKNTAIDPSLLSGVSTVRIWAADPNSPVQTRETGLGYIQYLEIENERDKWWKGRKAYQTGREYAAMASAYYDGHKGTLGNNVGAKQADPAMKLVVAGLALVRTDYIQGMIDWCRQYRGYLANGEVDLCFDIINYHQYSNDAGSVQYGTSTRGKAPELSNITTDMDRFLKFSNEKCYGKEVWVTETGYDVNQGSIQKAPAIGAKTGKDVQGDWLLRSSLLFSKKGIDRVMYYMFKDMNETNPGVFASCGFVESNSQLSIRRPSADYLKQAGDLIGNYTYLSTLNADPMVDHYQHGDSSVYVAWIPDETGRVGTYDLTLPPGHSSVKVYTLVKGNDNMNVTIEPAPGGIYRIPVSETPVFIQPIADIVLSVRPMQFTAAYDKVFNQVALHWSTSSEINTHLFMVERSNDNGLTWVSIGSVLAAGNSSSESLYNFIDSKPSENNNVYRLKLLDRDGSYSYSKIVVVKIEKELVIKLSPNPSKSVTYITLSNTKKIEAVVQLCDEMGKIIWKRKYQVNPGSPLKVDLYPYAAGNYFITVNTSNQMKTNKLVIK
ncbi:MAG: T9SS type A sorting domain-containing protein [Ferruginibacter sp.]